MHGMRHEKDSITIQKRQQKWKREKKIKNLRRERKREWDNARLLWNLPSRMREAFMSLERERKIKEELAEVQKGWREWPMIYRQQK